MDDFKHLIIIGLFEIGVFFLFSPFFQVFTLFMFLCFVLSVSMSCSPVLLSFPPSKCKFLPSFFFGSLALCLKWTYKYMDSRAKFFSERPWCYHPKKCTTDYVGPSMAFVCWCHHWTWGPGALGLFFSSRKDPIELCLPQKMRGPAISCNHQLCQV